MKRILDSSSKQSKISFDIQLDQQQYYFRGDVIEGRVLLQSPKPIKVKNIRLQWLGRVRVQLEPTLRDERELFKETTLMELPETESAADMARREAVKRAATTTIGGLFLVPSSPTKITHYVEANKLYSYPFSFIIPENTILPSCTESETNVGGIIEYIIEAYLERPVSDFSSSIKTQIRVPVLQRIDTGRPEQIVPQSVQVDCRGTSSLQGEGKDNTGVVMIVASVPKKAFIRNQPVPVTVKINHFEPFERKQALTVALIRVCRILCKGASYILPDSVIHSVKADIDLSNERNLSQTIVRSILIPQNISPTIGVNAQLLEISYKIRVRAQLQPDDPTRSYNMSMINLPTDFQSLALLTAELPIEIGTLPLPDKLIPPVPLNPQFVNYLDKTATAIASMVDADGTGKYYATSQQQQEDNNNLTPTTAEKVHMLKKMQKMLRLSSSPQIESAKQFIVDNDEQQLAMSKNELLTLFEEAASLKSNNSDESSMMTGTSVEGRHSSMSTFVSSSSEQSTTSQQKAIFPPAPTSPPPTVQQQRQSANTPATKNLPAAYRLSLGPEFSTSVRNSVFNEKPQQIDEEPYIPSPSTNTNNTNNNNINNDNTDVNNYKKLMTLITKVINHEEEHHHHHRRRINSDSIVLDLKHSNNNNRGINSPAASSSSKQQPQQHKRHGLTTSESSGEIEGGIHYFYMFPESDSSSSSEVEEKEEEQRRKNRLEKKKKVKSSRRKQECRETTPAGFEKPNCVSGVDVNEARIEKLQIVRQNNNNAPSSSSAPYPATHIDKPDELSTSEAEDLSSSHEEDLLDVLQRRDRKIASRMS